MKENILVLFEVFSKNIFKIRIIGCTLFLRTPCIFLSSHCGPNGQGGIHTGGWSKDNRRKKKRE